MTLTLDLPEEITSGLEDKAAILGVPVERYAAGVLRHDVEAGGAGGANGATRRRASGFGKFAHFNISSADVHRDRQEEVERDEAAFAARTTTARGADARGALA